MKSARTGLGYHWRLSIRWSTSQGKQRQKPDYTSKHTEISEPMKKERKCRTKKMAKMALIKSTETRKVELYDSTERAGNR